VRLTPEHPAAPAGRPLRARLAGGERLIGTFVKSRDPATTEALAVAGYDFVVADMEHSPLAVADVEGIARACSPRDVAVLARVPPSRLGLCGALLDAGATGIQVSDVSSAALAAEVAAAAWYPPRGERSLSLSTRAARFGTLPAAEHIARSDEHTVLVGQIESAAGGGSLASIIASGVFDALFLGATDLSVALGHPGDVRHPVVAAALADAAAVITGSGTPLGIFCGSADEAADWAQRGASMLAVSSDLSMLTSAAAATARKLGSKRD
jgi:2-keto-3-deoxy-L-rhamnonate aldolase RhmA